MSENCWLSCINRNNISDTLSIIRSEDGKTLYIGCQYLDKKKAKKALLVLSTYLNIKMSGQPKNLPNRLLFDNYTLCNYSIHQYKNAGLLFKSITGYHRYKISKKEVVKLHGILADFLGYEIVEE